MHFTDRNKSNTQNETIQRSEWSLVVCILLYFCMNEKNIFAHLQKESILIWSEKLQFIC